VRRAGHVARMGKMRNSYKILSKSLKVRDHWEDLGVDDKIILEWILGKEGRKAWTGCVYLRTMISGGML